VIPFLSVVKFSESGGAGIPGSGVGDGLDRGDADGPEGSEGDALGVGCAPTTPGDEPGLRNKKPSAPTATTTTAAAASLA
jgi:hypothetical protein